MFHKIEKVALAMLVLAASFQPVSAANSCSGSDCVHHEINITQDVCTEVTNKSPSSDARWINSLSLQADNQILGGDIVAYKLQWFSGSWSSWIVPGINDLDTKFNMSAQVRNGIPVQANSMRRMWSYFYDHNYSYIICKKQ
jgi:hypothetical protein